MARLPAGRAPRPFFSPLPPGEGAGGRGGAKRRSPSPPAPLPGGEGRLEGRLVRGEGRLPGRLSGGEGRLARDGNQPFRTSRSRSRRTGDAKKPPLKRMMS